MDKFFQFIQPFTHLGQASKEALVNIAQRWELPKGHLLVQAGTVCHYLYFIEAGLTRTFYDKDGKEVTDWLSAENSIACSIVSFITRKPDIRSIELLEPSILWALPYQPLENLYRQYHEIERLGRLMVSDGLVQLQQRFDDLHFATASQRYQKLLQSHPTFLQRVPLGMIASYLGVTQETLSRIRAQV